MPTHYSGSPEERLALNTFIKLTRSVEALMTRLTQHGTLGELTVSQFGVLEALYHLGSMCQNELASKILKSSGNMTLVIDNLEKHGLVQRERNTDDRRMVTVNLTQAGRELIEAILPEHVFAIQQEMSVLSPQEQQELGDLCRKLGKADPGLAARSSLARAETNPS
jgi:MarR family transcriptional regulator, 2-MHQ and catechol-resistance regulon repressor